MRPSVIACLAGPAAGLATFLGPAWALDPVPPVFLPPARIDGNGDIRLRPDFRIGRLLGTKYLATPDSVQIQGDGITCAPGARCDASGLNITTQGGSVLSLPQALATAVPLNRSFSGSFGIDSRTFLDPQNTNGPYVDFNVKASSWEIVTNTETLARTGNGGMRDGKVLLLRDRDDTNYESAGYRAITNGVRSFVFGKFDSGAATTQWKDLHAGWFYAMGRSGGTARGMSGILAEAVQLGTGVATNEFSASNPVYSNEQASNLSAIIGHYHNDKAASDSSHAAYGANINTYGFPGTAAIRTASVPSDASRTGATQYGLQMNESTVLSAGITMPAGSNGSIISYGANQYSNYDRTGKIFSWVVDGKTVMAATNAGWTSYGASITATSGTLGSASVSNARYTRSNNTVSFTAQVTITTNGTAAGGLQLSLPFPVATSVQIAAGRDDATGAMLQGKMVGNTCFIVRYDNTYTFQNGSIVYIGGTYEAQPL
ncbi:hypothetical protein [Methylobacterium sp. J-068]|uniref:hypothetical protein n=1 Tax=Methylobacterium sp. J-068 TaxID=2836649 RepID=UPI001FBA0585|nr:hypothetical protein [Methylobacterium sp. J-068]MCJ2037077.1 hypothetical protein [Methylobacterium sp. J-068]